MYMDADFDPEAPAYDPTVWRVVYETEPGDYYGHTISVSKHGAIRMEAGGYIVIKPDIRSWVATAMGEA